MSRRESRDSDPKRQSSRLDRESSPKRSRRDRKPEGERVVSKNDLDARDGTDSEKKSHKNLQDAAPLDTDSHTLSKDAEKRQSGHQETRHRSPNWAELPRSRSYYQHNDYDNAGKGDRRAPAERGWWRSSRDEIHGRASDNGKSEHYRNRGENMWQHDKFQENEDSARKRSFREEKKVPEESGNMDRSEGDHRKRSLHTHGELEGERRNNGRWDRKVGRERTWKRGERNVRRGNGNRQNYGMEREREGNGGKGSKDEKKWEHDLFFEANKSPPARNEEEQMEKLEALLAS